MQDQHHPLEPFFQQAVRNSYDGKLGLNDPDVTNYVARLLCEFSEAENLYKVRDETGRPIQELEDPAALESRSSHWSHNCRNLSKRGSRRYRPQSTNLSYERTVQLLGEQKQEGAADTDSRLPNTSDLRLPNRAG